MGLRTLPAISRERYASIPVRRATLALCSAGVLLAGLNGALVWKFPLFRYFPGPGVPLNLPEIFGDEWVAGVRWYSTLFALQFACYGAALALVHVVPQQTARRVTYAGAAVFAVVLTFMYPATSADLIHYLAASRIFWVWHDNPLVVPHGAYPFPLGLNYAGLPSPYGPLWTLLSFPGGLLSRVDLRLGLIGLKLLAASSFFLSAWLIDSTLRRLAPERAVLGLLAVAWNPFVLFRVVGNGHNSLVMMVFVLLAAYLAVTERWWGVGPALVAGILVKYVPVIFVPPLLIYLVRRCRLQGSQRPLYQLAAGTLPAVVVACVLWQPFWAGPDSLAVLREDNALLTSTPTVLAHQIAGWAIVDDPVAWARAVTTGIFGVIYLFVLWRLWRSDARPVRLLVGWYFVAISALVVAVPFFRPWYFLWFVPLGVLLPGRGYLLLTVVASLSVNFADPVEQFFERIPWIQESYGRMVVAPVAVQFVPLLLCLVGVLLLEHLRPGRGDAGQCG